MHALPGMELTGADPARPSAEVVAGYFDAYERTFDLRVRRPVDVRSVRESGDGGLLVETSDGTWCCMLRLRSVRPPAAQRVDGSRSVNR